jgi:hypothetical protein
MLTVYSGFILNYYRRDGQGCKIHEYVPNLWRLLAWPFKNSNWKYYTFPSIRRGKSKLMTDSQGRPVCDEEYEIEDYRTAYIIGATYYKTGEPVPDNELEYLTDAYAEQCSEYAFESMTSAAERYYEGER